MGSMLDSRGSSWLSDRWEDARLLTLLLAGGLGVFDLNCKLVYFILFAAYATLEPFLPIILEDDCGLSTAQVGIVYCAVPIVGLVCAPLWGILVDKTGMRKSLWCLAVAMGTLITAMLPLVHGVYAAWAYMAGRAVFVCTIVPMGDHAVMNFLGPERQHEYGRHRLYGAISWGVASFLTGIALTYLEAMASVILYAFGGGTFILFVIFSKLEDVELAVLLARLQRATRETESSASDLLVVAEGCEAGSNDGDSTEGAVTKSLDILDGDDAEEEVGEAATSRPALLAACKEVFMSKKNIVFYVTVLVMGMASRVIYNFLFIYLQELGGSQTLMGLSLVFTVAAEIPFFFVSGALMKRFGVVCFLVAAMVGYIVRVTAYSFLHNPWFVLPFETMHGLTFGAMWAAGIKQSTDLFPHYGGFAQGLFSGLYTGAGGFLGASIGGILYDTVGPRLMYRIMASAVALNLLVVVCFHIKELQQVIRESWRDLRNWWRRRQGAAGVIGEEPRTEEPEDDGGSARVTLSLGAEELSVL